MKITKTILIDCNRNVLWSWLTEFEKLQKWNSTIVKEEAISTGEPQKGHKSKVLIREGKREIWYDNEIIEYQPGNLLRIALSGGTLGKHPMLVNYQINEIEDQIELTLNSYWKPSGILLHLLYPFIKIKATKNTVEVLQSLKHQIENRTDII